LYSGHPFIRACWGEEVSYTPIWMMRQAGRYLPEYMEIRRSVSGFLELCKIPELATRVTLQPVERLGVDAAILFSDILVPVEAMGVPLEFKEGEGPELSYTVDSLRDVEALKVPDPATTMDFVLETVRRVKEILAGQVPLIGFSGAPFTLASYILEGGGSRHYLKTKAFMYRQPQVWHALMEKLTDTVVAYLRAQVEAGADTVQFFDSWVGALSPGDFREFVAPYTRRIVQEVRAMGVPLILFGTDTATLLDDLAAMGADVVGVDWRIEMKDAVEILDGRASVQGNLDPCGLFMPKDALEKRVEAILEQGRKARGHIFNLGHGILPQTDPNMAKFLVDTVHRLSKR
jgi:uroporphyrinogen decarboxylase